jgi:hypothetical protein
LCTSLPIWSMRNSPLLQFLVTNENLNAGIHQHPTSGRASRGRVLIILDHQIIMRVINTRFRDYHHQARWPSGLRRQLKVLPIRWSERAWVQIPLWSLSFCSSHAYRSQSENMGERIKNHLFVRGIWLESWNLGGLHARVVHVHVSDAYIYAQ